MKTLTNLLIIAAIILLCTYGVKAQTKASKTPDGNYKVVTPLKDTTNHDTPIGKTITDKDGKAYPVYRGSRGGLYYFKVSAKGGQRKVYIKQV